MYCPCNLTTIAKYYPVPKEFDFKISTDVSYTCTGIQEKLQTMNSHERTMRSKFVYMCITGIGTYIDIQVGEFTGLLSQDVHGSIGVHRQRPTAGYKHNTDSYISVLVTI